MVRMMILNLFKVLWRVVKVALVVAASVLLLFCYARWIEPQFLRVTQHDISPASMSSAKPVKLVQITDLHNQEFISPAYFYNKVNNQQPDIIALTGDVIDGREDKPTYIQEYLAPLKAKSGKYFVFGNNEYSSKADRATFIAQMEKAGFIILKNSNRKLSVNGQTLWLIGVDDPHTGRDRLDQAMVGVGKGTKILLAHSPEIIDQAVIAGLELVLVGHTHGGQVWLPGLANPVVNVREGYAHYLRGIYSVGHTQMYVNPGIGTTRLPFRFLVPPEVAVFNLTKRM